MNTPKVDDEEYIHFLLATPGRATCLEAERTLREAARDPAHDAYNRLLYRQPQDSEALWREACPLLTLKGGVLVLDDSTLDKPYARHTELVTYHWSGKHQAVVRGINLQTLLWTDGSKLIPCDFRVATKGATDVEQTTKNESFQAMLTEASERGMKPDHILFDTWYGGLENLKHIRTLGWHWTTRFKKNRRVNPDNTKNRLLEEIEISPQGKRVHLRGYGFIKVFRVMRGDEVQFWATSDLSALPRDRENVAKLGWKIEVYHRGLKQCCSVEKSQVRISRAIRVHIGLAVRAFLRVEFHRLIKKTSWYDLLKIIWRPVVKAATKSRVFSMTWSTA